MVAGGESPNQAAGARIKRIYVVVVRSHIHYPASVPLARTVCNCFRRQNRGHPEPGSLFSAP